jgi:hypothetical protein
MTAASGTYDPRFAELAEPLHARDSRSDEYIAVIEGVLA